MPALSYPFGCSHVGEINERVPRRHLTPWTGVAKYVAPDDFNQNYQAEIRVGSDYEPLDNAAIKKASDNVRNLH